MAAKEMIAKILPQANTQLNGSNPWDIQVKDERFFRRILSDGVLGLGESYMDGWWECDAIDEFVFRVLNAELDKKINFKSELIKELIFAKILNMQSRNRAYQVGEKHYDLGNDLFENMLDKRMVYSCAYWNGANNIDQAQENKLDLICRKLELKPGMKILDIGCGWGSFINYAAEKYGVNAVGITISKEQVKLIEERKNNLPVKAKLQDYRELNEKFDRIISIGMFEHVGYKNYKTFMNIAHRCLKDDGLFLLHTIGGNFSVKTTDAWTQKYIFPNGMLPSIKQIGNAIENLFVMEDWHNFGADYDKTLMAWYANFIKNWEKIKSNYDERFFRMWKFFLLSSAGAFRARKNQLWQIVLSKNGVTGGYKSIR